MNSSVIAWRYTDGACSGGHSCTVGEWPPVIGTCSGLLPKECFCNEPPSDAVVELWMGDDTPGGLAVTENLFLQECATCGGGEAWTPKTFKYWSNQPLVVPPCPSESSSKPIRYATGSIVLSATDVFSAGFGGPWGHTRVYENRLSVSETVGNGFNWQVTNWPHLVFQYGGIISVQSRATGPLWYDLVSGTYRGRYGVPQTLTRDASTGLFTLTEADGSKVEFHGTSGAFRKLTLPSGHTISVLAYATKSINPSVIERTDSPTSPTVTEQLAYEYDGSSGDQLIANVVLRRKIGSGAWQNITRANYEYYGVNELFGAEEDLKKVVTQTWEGGAWVSTGTSYYRYYDGGSGSSSSSSMSSASSSSTGGGGGGGGSSSSSAAPGKLPSHLLQYVVNPAAYQRMLDAGVTPETASNTVLAQYADQHFEYDSSRRVTRETVNGGSRVYEFAYSQSAFSDGVNRWKFKTTETLPDGSSTTRYMNYLGETMLTVTHGDGEEWLDFLKFDERGNVLLHAYASAITGYDEAHPDLLNEGASGYQYLRNHVGRIETFTYHNPSNIVTGTSVMQGQAGTPIKRAEYEVSTLCSGSSSSSASSGSSSSSSSAGSTGGVYVVTKETLYLSDTDPSKTAVTRYEFTTYSGTCAVKEKITTLPVVSTSENGDGIAATRRDYFDLYGNHTWSMDERGFITRMVYDIPTGAVIQRIDDVDTSTATGVPAGWTTPSGGGLNLVTDYEIDSQGRTTQVLGPVHQIDLSGTATTIRRATWMVYNESSTGRTTLSGQGYATGTSPSYTYTLINPVSITKSDLGGRTTEQIAATRGSGTTSSGKLLASDTFAQSSYVRWSTMQYTDCCFVASQRVYHTIPASGSGSSGTNYDQTTYGYSVMKRRNRTVTPGGTITFLVYDVRGQVLETWVGTNDTGATENDPSGGGASGNNMQKITALEYDGGVDGGDGNVTKQTQYATASDTRVTTFAYDFRDRRIETDGEIDYFEKLTLDNLDRVTRVDRYDTSTSGNLVGRSDTKYDARGRVWRTIRYGVDPSTGTVGQSLTDNTWYDAAGNTLCSVPSGALAFSKTVYDSLGRPATRTMGYNATATTSAPLGSGTPASITADVILEQSETVYDAAGNGIESRQRQRYHNAAESQTGALQNPSNNPKARVTYAASYPDALGRQQATADYGTNGGTALSRPTTVPARSDTCLVTSQTYSAAGNILSTTDPAGLVTAFTYDAVGRELTRTQNPQVSSSSSSTGNTCGASEDANVMVTTAYNADGNVSSVTASNASTGPQTTQYVYGTTLSDSEVASSLLKRAEIYPDSTGGSDQITFAYNRQSQVTTMVDQGGTTHAYDYDKLGRQTQDRVTALGSGVDGAVRRISSTYEVRGMRRLLSSHDNATVGAGNVLNQSQFVYNDFSQLVTEYQAHEGAVNTSTTPKVQYTYANGSSNTIRKTGMVYPSGRVLTYSYGSAGTVGDRVSRVASYIDDDGSSHIVDYTYLGAGTFVEGDRPQPQMKWTLIDLSGSTDPDTGDIYSGLDRFGRVKDNRWYGYGTSTDLDRIQYGYDRAGNRIWRRNTVAAALSKEFDEIYTYDALHRLKDMERGLLNTSRTALTSKTFAQCWTLDSTGNWSGFREDDTGDGTWDLVQARSANDVNEITGITNSVGASWVQPAYSAAGNMTTMPQPNDPTKGFSATYDAWNRLVSAQDLSQRVYRNEFDATHRRVLRIDDSPGSHADETHFFYSRGWRCVELQNSSSHSTATYSREFVWGRQYLDELILRDCVASATPTSSSSSSCSGDLQRLYATQDATWSVCACTNAGGVVENRFVFSSYGDKTALTAGFTPTVLLSSDWEFTYSAYLEDASSLLCCRFRFLNSSVGLFVSRDPIGYASALNLYGYCGASPVNAVDPTGLITEKEAERVVSCFLTQLPTGNGNLAQGGVNSEDCNAKILGKLYGEGLVKGTGDIGKGIIDAVFQDLPDELQNLSKVKDVISDIIDAMDDPGKVVDDKLLDQLSKRTGMSKDRLKKIHERIKSKLTGDCIHVEQKYESSVKEISTETKCDLLVCIQPGSPPTWSVTGTCDYKCTVTPSNQCCCGTSRQIFIQASGSGHGGSGAHCKSTDQKLTN